MGTDQANGRFSLDNNQLDLDYNFPAPAQQPIFGKLEEVMRAMAQAMGAEYKPFPLWKGLADRKLVTIFPLGGCPMGPTSTDGVVDEAGRVYNTQRRHQTTHPGLYVTDASIIPGPLAVQPSLTIVALALRVATALRDDPT
jgi:cholesterol oxidase